LVTRRELIEKAIAVAGTAWFVPDSFAQTLARASNQRPPSSQLWDVRQFGAKGDGKTLDTSAVQAAIDACHQAGGGAVHFASGCTFLIGTIYLKDHVELQLDANSVLLGSDRLADYGKDVGLNPFYPETIDPCLIYAKNCADIRIGGNGTIVGHTGDDFEAPPGADERARKERPMLIRFENCGQISVVDVSLKHCGSWCMHLKNSHDIFLRNIRIANEKQDGFDLESCQNVSISDCHLECGDDAIAITTSSRERPARNITITNCLMRSQWSAIRFGPLSKGDFENITVSNCVFYDCNGGGIKLGMFEGAEIRDCLFDNLVMDQVVAPITMFVATWPDIGSLQPSPPMMPAGKISDLQFRGIRAIAKPEPPNPRPDANDGLFFHGHPQGLIENILLRDVAVTLSGGGTLEQAARRDIVDMNQIDYRKDGYWTDHKSTWGVPPAYGLYARHMRGLVLENVSFELTSPDMRSAVFCSDSEDIRISNLAATSSPDTSVVTARNCIGVRLSNTEPRPKAAVLLRLEGAKSDGVILEDNDPRGFTKPFLCTDGASENAIHSKQY
jgi:Glycosyl hydrolases family 28